jgi:hypothetical protein
VLPLCGHSLYGDPNVGGLRETTIMTTLRLAPLGLLAAALGDAAISVVLLARYPA